MVFGYWGFVKEFGVFRTLVLWNFSEMGRNVWYHAIFFCYRQLILNHNIVGGLVEHGNYVWKFVT